MSAAMAAAGSFRSGGADASARYAAGVLPLLERAGARVRERLKGGEAFVGASAPDAVAVIEFPDEAAMRTYLASSEYAVCVPHRDAAFADITTFGCVEF